MLHCLADGEHVPVQAPVLLLHTKGHGVPTLVHTPLVLQTCGWRPLHCFVLGVHAAQEPPLHAVGHAAPEFCQAPFASQTWGCKLLHCRLEGVQVPAQAAVVASQRKGQAAPLSCQAPVASHS